MRRWLRSCASEACSRLARFTWTQTAQQTLAVYRSQMAGQAQTH